MRLALKTTAIAFGVLVVATVALGGFLLLYFDPNDYKTQIEAKLEEKTSRKITISGEMDLSVFPWLGIDVGEVSMANAPGFGTEPFASVKAAEISVSLLPLLRKEIQIGSVMLDGLVLRLQKNAVGQNNWDDIGEKKTPEEEEKDDDEVELDSLEVAALEIKQASVLWDDAQKGSRYQLNDFNFTTGRLRSGDPFMVESDFILVTGKPPVSRKVELDTEVTADLEKKTYRLEDFVLKSGPGGQTAPQGEPPLALRGEVDMDLAKQTLAIADLVLETGGLKVTGAITGTKILDGGQFKGQIKSDEINPREMMKALGKEEPKTTDGSVLKKARFEAGFAATSERADLRPIAIQLDDSKMNGTVSIANYSNPVYGFDLVVDELDLDRYLSPKETKGAATTGAGAGDGTQEEGEVSVDAIRNLNLNGTLKVGKFKMRNLRFSDAHLTLHAKDGIMAIEPLTANFYQGRINMTGRVDGRGARPAYAIRAQTSGIAVEPMLVALNGQSKITGTGSVNLNVHTAGGNTNAIKRGLNGTMSFNLRDGEFKGFNLAQKIRNARAMYKGEPVDNSAPQSTPFSAISGEANIVNGVLRNDDLDGQSPAFKVSGNGTANLVSETLDYLARVAVLDPRGEGAAQLEELKSLTIPVRVTGTFDNPQFKVDIAAALKEVAKEKVREKIEEKREEAKDKLKEKLDEKLKDLFNRGGDDEPAQQ